MKVLYFTLFTIFIIKSGSEELDKKESKQHSSKPVDIHVHVDGTKILPNRVIVHSTLHHLDPKLINGNLNTKVTDKKKSDFSYTVPGHTKFIIKTESIPSHFNQITKDKNFQSDSKVKNSYATVSSNSKNLGFQESKDHLISGNIKGNVKLSSQKYSDTPQFEKLKNHLQYETVKDGSGSSFQTSYNLKYDPSKINKNLKGTINSKLNGITGNGIKHIDPNYKIHILGSKESDGHAQSSNKKDKLNLSLQKLHDKNKDQSGIHFSNGFKESNGHLHIILNDKFGSSHQKEHNSKQDQSDSNKGSKQSNAHLHITTKNDKYSSSHQKEHDPKQDQSHSNEGSKQSDGHSHISINDKYSSSLNGHQDSKKHPSTGGSVTYLINSLLHKNKDSGSIKVDNAKDIKNDNKNSHDTTNENSSKNKPNKSKIDLSNKNSKIGLLGHIKNKIDGAISTSVDKIYGLKDGIKNGVNGVISSTVNEVGDLETGIEHGVNGAISSTIDGVTGVENGIKNKVNGVIYSAIDGVTDIKNGIKNKVNGYISSTVDGIKNGIYSIPFLGLHLIGSSGHSYSGKVKGSIGESQHGSLNSKYDSKITLPKLSGNIKITA